MIRCSQCVMPDTRPDVPFTDGVCQACINYANRPTIDWEARQKELIDLLDRHHGECIVPSSGGKDSHAQVMKMLQMGVNVTVVTATTCFLTKIGRMNIDNLARHARTIEVTPNRRIRAVLNRKGTEMVGDPSWPQHSSIWAIPFRMAVELKKPLLIWGENSQSQYGGPAGTELARQMTRRWCAEFGGLNGLRPMDFVGTEGIREADMQDYMLPSDQDIESVGVEAHFLGAYQPWDSHENARIAKEAGMIQVLPCSANWWHHENLDCFFTFWHDAFMFRKFGYGRGCAQISIDIRAGLVKREFALDWVRAHDGEFQESYMGIYNDQGLERIGMTRAELTKTIDAFTNWELFSKAGNGHRLLKEFEADVA